MQSSEYEFCIEESESGRVLVIYDHTHSKEKAGEFKSISLIFYASVTNKSRAQPSSYKLTHAGSTHK